MQEIAQASGLAIRQLVNTKSQTFKKLKPELLEMNDQQIRQLIQENPSIMLRPILIADGKSVIGFKEEEYHTFLTEMSDG